MNEESISWMATPVLEHTACCCLILLFSRVSLQLRAHISSFRPRSRQSRRRWARWTGCGQLPASFDALSSPLMSDCHQTVTQRCEGGGVKHGHVGSGVDAHQWRIVIGHKQHFRFSSPHCVSIFAQMIIGVPWTPHKHPRCLCHHSLHTWSSYFSLWFASLLQKELNSSFMMKVLIVGRNVMTGCI